MRPPVGCESPSVSAWLSASRSSAWLAASRTRRSCHGDFGIPLLGQVEEDHAGRHGGGEAQARRALDLLGGGAAQQIDDVHVARLERGGPRGLVGHAAEDEALDRGDFSPVPLEGLHDQVDARVEAHHLVRPRADGRLLEPILAHLLHVLARHDPRGAGGGGPVEGHEVRPRLLQVKPDAARIDDLHVPHAILEQLGGGALVALERELDVVRGHRVAVVELRVLAQDELVDEAVLRGRPGLGQARGVLPARHRLHERVVHGVEHHERVDERLGVARIEPLAGQRDVEPPGERALGRGGGRRAQRGRAGGER